MLQHLFEPSERESSMSRRPVEGSQVALRAQSQARYQALRHSDFTGVYTCDSAGVITYYNAMAAELWGRKPAIGDTDERFCGSHMLYRTDGKFMPHHECPMADVLAARAPGIFDADVFIQRPNGSRVVVIVNIAPLIDDTGAIVGAVNSFRENPLRKVNGGHAKA